MRLNWRKLFWNFTGLIQFGMLLSWAGFGVLSPTVVKVTHNWTLVLIAIALFLLWFLFRKVRKPFKNLYSLLGYKNADNLRDYFLKRHPIINHFVDNDDRVQQNK